LGIVGIAQNRVGRQLGQIVDRALVHDQRPAQTGDYKLVHGAQGRREVMMVEMMESRNRDLHSVMPWRVVRTKRWRRTSGGAA
jgi:hypothetical protein